ncbi:MAG: TIR domain-containing protein [Sphingomonas sp.]
MNAIATEDYDIFISYAEPDNHLPAPRDNWVKRLAKDLPAAVQFQLQRLPRVYFDENCAEPNRDWDYIEGLCRRARVFVAVASPNYLSREWPLREFDAYVASKGNLDGLFVAALAKLDKDSHPVIGPRTHLRFFPDDRRETQEMESAFPVPPDSGAFQDLLFKLAASIAKYLKTDPAAAAAPAPAAAKARAEPRAKPAKAPKDTAPARRVLLAQCSEDLDDEHAAVRSYLEQFDIEVLPRTEYPLGGEAFREAFAEDLAQASHFIQLLGPRPGRRPPDLPEGYVIHQADAALDAEKPILQWRGVNWQLSDRVDADYAGLLKRETVIASTLEEFKDEARRLVTAPPPPKIDASKKGFVVYVNAELADRAVAEWLSSEFPQYSIFLPDYDATGSNQETSIANLRDCRALLLLYGEAGLAWVNGQMREALKHLGDDIPRGAVCMGPPTDKRPLNFSVPDIPPLDCRNGDQWMIEPIRQRLAELSR